jgi:hypothetical protein
MNNINPKEIDLKEIDSNILSKLKKKISDDFNELYSNKNQIITTIKDKSYVCFTYVYANLCLYLKALIMFIALKLDNFYKEINKFKDESKSQGDLTFCKIREYINNKEEKGDTQKKSD